MLDRVVVISIVINSSTHSIDFLTEKKVIIIRISNYIKTTLLVF